MNLILLDDRYAVAQLAADAAVPATALDGEFWSCTRTREELSLVCREAAVPAQTLAVGGWRCLRVAGQLSFTETGILAALAKPLAIAGISLFALSTFNTDYLLVQETDLQRALDALQQAGHQVASPSHPAQLGSAVGQP